MWSGKKNALSATKLPTLWYYDVLWLYKGLDFPLNLGMDLLSEADLSDVMLAIFQFSSFLFHPCSYGPLPVISTKKTPFIECIIPLSTSYN